MKHEKEYFIRVCEESRSACQAASRLGMHFNTFKRYALKFGCYCPNQGLKGHRKNSGPRKIPLDSILNGEHPQYQTNKLKKRLIKEGIKNNVCEVCGLLGYWNNAPLIMELNHINGNKYNHDLDNLQTICPNCHSQTETFRGKNIKN